MSQSPLVKLIADNNLNAWLLRELISKRLWRPAEIHAAFEIDRHHDRIRILQQIQFTLWLKQNWRKPE